MSEPVDKRRLTELRSLLSTIEEAGWEYARVEIDGVTLVVSSDPEFAAATTAPASASLTAVAESPTAPAAAATPAAQAVTDPAPTPDEPAPSAPPAAADGPRETVTSPTIGLFWRSPKPGAPPFVEVGDTVTAGTTLCIIEVMKLMTHVTAPIDGTVAAIHIDNGSMVEHGTALIDVAPAGTAEAGQ